MHACPMGGAERTSPPCPSWPPPRFVPASAVVFWLPWGGRSPCCAPQTEYARLENGRFVYRIHRSPMCEYMINFIHKLKHLPEKYMMNSVLENFTILQVPPRLFQAVCPTRSVVPTLPVTLYRPCCALPGPGAPGLGSVSAHGTPPQKK